jgi:hypothetical protein
MVKFLKKLVVFLIPILIVYGSIEYYIRNSPNSFITKAKYFKQNEAKIEVLILGTSHSQNGINPKYFKENACNLAYGSQDIQLDSALFFSNVKKMKSLKKVLFELDYHRMDIENEKDFYRFPWYYIYYGIEMHLLNPIQKISLYASNTSFFNNMIKNDINGTTKPQVINKFGFVEANYNNEFERVNYDSIKIYNSAKNNLENRHKEISNENFERNNKRIISMIKYCQLNNIEFYIVSSPLHQTYIENEIPKKAQKVYLYINKLTKKYHLNYLNFERDIRFHLKDFSNEDHLNANGAEKYSKLLDAKINNQ